MEMYYVYRCIELKFKKKKKEKMKMEVTQKGNNCIITIDGITRRVNDCIATKLIRSLCGKENSYSAKQMKNFGIILMHKIDMGNGIWVKIDSMNYKKKC